MADAPAWLTYTTFLETLDGFTRMCAERDLSAFRRARARSIGQAPGSLGRALVRAVSSAELVTQQDPDGSCRVPTGRRTARIGLAELPNVLPCHSPACARGGFIIGPMVAHAAGAGMVELRLRLGCSGKVGDGTCPNRAAVIVRLSKAA